MYTYDYEYNTEIKNICIFKKNELSVKKTWKKLQISIENVFMTCFFALVLNIQ